MSVLLEVANKLGTSCDPLERSDRPSLEVADASARALTDAAAEVVSRLSSPSSENLLADLAQSWDQLPDQGRRRYFGQPPVTLYRGACEVAVLFWRGNVLDAHTHSFIGAFSPLTGRAVDIPLVCTGSTPRGDGSVEEVDAVLGSPVTLDAGEVMPIRAGWASCHKTVHLEPFSASLVVYLRHPDVPKAKRILAPGLAVANELTVDDDWVTIDGLRLIHELERRDRVDVAGRLLRTMPSDAAKLIALWQAVLPGLSQQECMTMVDQAELTDSLVDDVQEAMLQILMTRTLVSGRSVASDRRRRALIALSSSLAAWTTDAEELRGVLQKLLRAVEVEMIAKVLTPELLEPRASMA